MALLKGICDLLLTALLAVLIGFVTLLDILKERLQTPSPSLEDSEVRNGKERRHNSSTEDTRVQRKALHTRVQRNALPLHYSFPYPLP